jgi:ABC-2 type transport system permease protein
VVGFIDICLILAVGALFFDVKVAGSLGLLLALSGLFTAGALALGLLISSIARTQQVAFTISMISTVLPTMILSGFVFPIRNMPLVVQAVTYIVPARYFLVILRGIILKGVGMAELLPEVAALTLYTVVLLTLAALRWRKRID